MTVIWKIWSELPRAFFCIFIIATSFLVNMGECIYPNGLVAKMLFATDFELWSNISLQRNIISTIGEKLVNPQGHPYMPPNLMNFGLETAENGWRVFAHSPKFSRWETLPLPGLSHGRYITDSRQTLSRLMYSGTSLQSRTTECRAGWRRALPCILFRLFCTSLVIHVWAHLRRFA